MPSLCSEVLKHVFNPTKAIHEFARLLNPGGKLILTAPIASLVHFAPYHYCPGFSRYWHEHHLAQCGFCIEELTPNGAWLAYCRQELTRLGSMVRRYDDWTWPLTFLLNALSVLYFKVQGGKQADDLACFGWECLAVKCR